MVVVAAVVFVRVTDISRHVMEWRVHVHNNGVKVNVGKIVVASRAEVACLTVSLGGVSPHLGFS